MPNNDATATEEAIDELVLTAAGDDWLKVALLLAKVTDAARASGMDTSSQAIAARVYALVDGGRLEAKGNVRRWRAGEVRKPAG